VLSGPKMRERLCRGAANFPGKRGQEAQRKLASGSPNNSTREILRERLPECYFLSVPSFKPEMVTRGI